MHCWVRHDTALRIDSTFLKLENKKVQMLKSAAHPTLGFGSKYWRGLVFSAFISTKISETFLQSLLYSVPTQKVS